LEKGNRYYNAKDHSKAVQYYQLSADKGNSTAQFNLGVCYQNGQGVIPDYSKAVQYFQLSADQGNSTAQFNLGLLYQNGIGVSQDLSKALKYFQLSSIQGYSNAQRHLGLLLEKDFKILFSDLTIGQEIGRAAYAVVCESIYFFKTQKFHVATKKNSSKLSEQISSKSDLHLMN